MVALDLDRLVSSEGERTLLVIGEEHSCAAFDDMHRILYAYQPDVVAVELAQSPDNVDTLEQFMEMRPGELAEEVFAFPTPMTISIVNAIRREVPLYLADWNPYDPHLIEAFAPGESTIFPYDHLHAALAGDIQSMFGKSATKVPKDVEKEMSFYLIDDMTPEERREAASYSFLAASNKGVAVRNLWSAAALREIPGERVLYVAGSDHTSARRKRKDGDNLQDLVEVDRKLYINLNGSWWDRRRDLKHYESQRFPIEVHETLPSELEGPLVEEWLGGED